MYMISATNKINAFAEKVVASVKNAFAAPNLMLNFA